MPERENNGWLFVNADEDHNAILDHDTESSNGMDTDPKHDNQVLALHVKDVRLTNPQRTWKIRDPVNLSVPKGKIYALLGPANERKEALLECILGLDQPDEGEIRVLGQIPRASDPGSRVGYASGERFPYSLSIGDTARFFGRLHGMPESIIEQRIDVLMKTLDLDIEWEWLRKGESYVLSIATALIHSPSLLIVREPSHGLDSWDKKRAWLFLTELNRTEGTSILVLTEDVGTAKWADIVGYIRDGRILTQTPCDRPPDDSKCETLEEAFYELCLADSEENDSEKDSEQGLEESSGDRSEADSEEDSSEHPRDDAEATSGLMRLTAPKIVKSYLCRRPGWVCEFSGSTRRMLLLADQFGKKPIDFKRIFYLSFPMIVLFACVCIRIFTEPSALVVAVVNSDTRPVLSKLFLESIPAHAIVQLPHTDLDEALESLEEKRVVATISLEDDFSEALELRLSSNVSINGTAVYIDIEYTCEGIGLFLQKIIEESFATACEELRAKNYTISSPEELPIRVRRPVDEDTELNYYRSVLPRFELISCSLMTFALTVCLVPSDLREGILRPLVVAGMRPLEVIIARIIWMRFIVLPYFVFALVFVFVAHPQESSFILVMLAFIVEGLLGIAMGLSFSLSCTSDSKLSKVVRPFLFVQIVMTIPTFFIIALFVLYGRFLWLPRFPSAISFGTPPTDLVEFSLRLLKRGLEENQVPVDFALPLLYSAASLITIPVMSGSVRPTFFCSLGLGCALKRCLKRCCSLLDAIRMW